MNRCCVGHFVAVGVFAVAGTASAQGSPGQVTLRWSAPDECPDDVRFLHQIETLLGQSLLETKGPSLTVRASAQGNPERGYAGKISFASPQGDEERFLSHPGCEKLVEAMALVVALAIDPERVQTAQNAREAAGGLVAPTVEAAPMPKTGGVWTRLAIVADNTSQLAVFGERLFMGSYPGSGDRFNLYQSTLTAPEPSTLLLTYTASRRWSWAISSTGVFYGDDHALYFTPGVL